VDPTPDRTQPASVTATVTTTPLAPMLPIAVVTPAPTASSNCEIGAMQLNNNLRRESTQSDNSGYYNITAKRRLSQNDAAGASVSRTMSTRSCGEPNNNYPNVGQDMNPVVLRHTQSAREANNNNNSGGGGGSVGGGDSNEELHQLTV